MKRNKFGLSNYVLDTMPMGKLVPVNWFEVLPGDTVQQATSALVRVTPLNTPIMHPVRVRIHHFYVPNRLVWNDFDNKFITGGSDGLDATAHPQIDIGTVTEGSLADHLGIPPAEYSGLMVNALPFRVYNLIFNEHYRDQDLVTEKTVSLDNGEDTDTEMDLLDVAWEKDYFTTCRSDPQKGSGVTIPLGDTAPLVSDAVFDGDAGTDNWIQVRDSSGNLKRLRDTGTYVAGGGTADGTRELVADLSGATGIDISDLRLALAIQRYQEARMRYGSRYVEYLRSLGVRSSDARLALPEYIGGGRNTIQFSEVLAHDGSNTGTMYGHGLGAMRTNRYRRFIEEHGIIMTLMSVVPKTIYANGLHRSWLREVKEDYYTRELAMIGEQEVKNIEVYSEHATPDGTFGYQARYDEYRSLPSSVRSEFRGALNTWHMARIFGSDPALNSTFINCSPTTRVYQSTATDPLLVMCQHSIQARRQMQLVAKTKTF